MALRYPPTDGRPYRIVVGLRPLDPARWLEVDGHREAELARKRELLHGQHDLVVATLPLGSESSKETLNLIVDHLAEHFPELPRQPDPQLHPIDAAGRLVQEDLCVLVREGGSWRLAAASVCFPSRWTLADKIGRDLDQIHRPVPGYERIAGPSHGALDRITPGRPMWRINWSLLGHDELFQPAGWQPDERPPVPPSPADLTVRVERQTLRALPRTGAVLFTIRTYRDRLGDLRQQPALLRDLADSLRTVPVRTQAYKGWVETLPQILAWLDEQACPTARTQAPSPGATMP